jgi:hypothetical protein
VRRAVSALRFGVQRVRSRRRVSLDTVRAQIRDFLRKTGASGLRDLERIVALYSTMHMDAGITASGVQLRGKPLAR